MTRRREDKAWRDREIWRHVVILGWQQQDVADKFNLTQGRISQIVRDVNAQIPIKDKEQHMSENLEMLRELRRRYMEIVEMTPAPMTAGAKGQILVDPESGQYVRDYAARLSALAGLRGVLNDQAKRLGLDAPAQAELHSTVLYEVTGVDVEDLK